MYKYKIIDMTPNMQFKFILLPLFSFITFISILFITKTPSNISKEYRFESINNLNENIITSSMREYRNEQNVSEDLKDHNNNIAAEPYQNKNESAKVNYRI